MQKQPKFHRTSPNLVTARVLSYPSPDLLLHRTQALILSPTRELAVQTEKTVLSVGDFMNVQAHACIGGRSIGEDIRKLEFGVQVTH